MRTATPPHLRSLHGFFASASGAYYATGTTYADALAGGAAARRVAGDDRFATAAAIALDTFPRAPVIHLATGLNFPDALAGTVAAARDGAPLLLTLADCVTPTTRDAAVALGAVDRVVLEGTAVVTDRAAGLTPC